ncbi:hypothetical protein BJ138DRAFT_1124884 [Hygrophoropsis aurantiaca]|uniref:Uncharacterized protein n=1 Tax=Hygrophoropsis aurantiaca TaxID=72124 RepID=A0ACB8AHC4_9AGAM|nr:hypothetical protein BJ138DRAFT_1124884 [Hygrophoropsis aurantiaca]
MARKKRLTHRKQSKPYKAPDGVPTKEEWNTLEEFGRCVVTDEEEVEYKIGDVVFILPEGKVPGTDVPAEEYWLGKIKGIRGRRELDASQIWVHIQWYWSGKEVSSVIKSFPWKTCSNFERIFSDYHDYVPTQCLSGIATIKQYDERDTTQDHLDDDDFFTRYTFEYKARKISPKPASCIGLCGKPYNLKEVPIMHFCPRPTCKRAYHRACLRERFCDPDEQDIGRRLMENWPNTHRHRTIEDIISESSDQPPSKRRKGNSTFTTRRISASNALDEFPNELIKVAQQPIIKGTGVPGGIVGNIKAVTIARGIIYDVLAHGGAIPDDWRSQMGLDLDGSTSSAQGIKSFPNKCFVCPECGSRI